MQITFIASPVKVERRASEVPWSSGRSDLKFWPIKRTANPDWAVGPSGKKTESMVCPGGKPWTMSLNRYIVRIMKASVRPTVTKNTATVAETSAWSSEYFCKARARTPPDEAATVSVTTGSSQTAVIACSECFCDVFLKHIKRSDNLRRRKIIAYMKCTRTQQHSTDIKTSNHQIAHMKYKNGLPPKWYFSLITSTATLMRVVAAIGKQPVYRLEIGCRIIEPHI